MLVHLLSKRSPIPLESFGSACLPSLEKSQVHFGDSAWPSPKTLLNEAICPSRWGCLGLTVLGGTPVDVDELVGELDSASLNGQKFAGSLPK